MGRPKILIVNDGAREAAGIRAQLHQLGFDVVGAEASMVEAPDPQAQLERQLAQTQKMAAVGLFAAGVAHDFNNAIAALRAQLYVAQIQLGQALPLDECRAILDRCSRLADWLISLASAADSGAAVLGASDSGTRTADLRQCVSSALQIVKYLLPSSICVETELGTGSSLVRLDPDLMVHSVINLLLNARDALPHGGIIKTKIKLVSHQQYLLTVEDSGHGMDPETLRRAFEPFFSTKAPGSGAGLGLPSVRRIIETAGGTVALVSEVGVGTRVMVTLPCVLEAVSSEPAPHPRPGSSESEVEAPGTPRSLGVVDEPSYELQGAPGQKCDV